jgi:hypothetical protein
MVSDHDKVMKKSIEIPVERILALVRILFDGFNMKI